jgi:hypothetical protein
MRPPSCHVLIERTGTNHRAAASRDEIRLFARCRNEILRLPAFFQHYRAMGVDRFYIVDNESYGRAPLTECPGFLILLHFKLLHDLHAKARARPRAASIHEARWSTGGMRERWIRIRGRRSCTKARCVSKARASWCAWA